MRIRWRKKGIWALWAALLTVAMCGCQGEQRVTSPTVDCGMTPLPGQVDTVLWKQVCLGR